MRIAHECNQLGFYCFLPFLSNLSSLQAAKLGRFDSLILAQVLHAPLPPTHLRVAKQDEGTTALTMYKLQLIVPDQSHTLRQQYTQWPQA